MPSLGIARKRNIPLLFVIFAVNEFSFVYIWISIISDVGMISILYLIESENKINIQKHSLHSKANLTRIAIRIRIDVMT